MLQTPVRSVLNRSLLLSRIAWRSYRTHGASLFYPPSSGVAPLVECELNPRSRVHQQGVATEQSLATSRSLKDESLQNTMLDTVQSPSAAVSMRMTQPLSSKVISDLSPTFQQFALNGKVAIVTDGARGLGLNMTQALCESGVKAVAIFDIQPELGQALAHALSTSTGIPVKYHNVNVLDETSVETAVSQVVQEFGSIDILINSAGVAFSNIPAETYEMADFEKTININLVGSFRIAQAVGRHMIAATPPPPPTTTDSPTTPRPQPSSLPDRSIILIASMSGTIVN